MSEEIIILTIYLIGLVPLGLYFAYRLGTLTEYERNISAFAYVWIVIFWPAFILLLPFIGMYNLGAKERTRRLEKEYKEQGLL